jgi:ABC-2 type transport system permease protein
MRHFWILFKHELRMLLISPTTYLAASLFLALMGFLYWAILRDMITTPQNELPAVQFFKTFWIPTFFVIPLLTMRSIAGERSIGTLDTLLTTPTSRLAVILGKFAGAYSFYLFLWVLTLGFPLIANVLLSANNESPALLRSDPILGSFTFIAVSGVLFVAIGIFTSSLTRSQLVAAMLAFTLLFVVIVGGQQLGTLAQGGVELTGWLDGTVNYLKIFSHLDDFAHGIIDTRPFFYYLSAGILLLGLSTLVIEAKA